MTYEQILAAARGQMGPCKACPVCNGLGCKHTIPGPGAKGSGTVAARNYQAWQELLLNMDTITSVTSVDTSAHLFGRSWRIPVFAAPIGAVQNHYGSKLEEEEYTQTLVGGCAQSGIAAFTGDGLQPRFFQAGCQAMAHQGFAIPTVKPWHQDLVFQKIDEAKAQGAKVIAMDIDASGLPFLKQMDPPSGPKTVEQLSQIIRYADLPFYLKGIMTVSGAKKALEAGAAGIIISNHGGRVLDHTPATAQVLPAIAQTVGQDITVLVDGGIRTGYDVFRALALGAKGVLIGRPFVTMVYGGGKDAVGVYVDKLQRELADAMEMCSCATLEEITKDVIYHE